MRLEPASVRPSVRPSVRAFTLLNMNISTTSRAIPINFYLRHHLGGGKTALGFAPDRVALIKGKT